MTEQQIKLYAAARVAVWPYIRLQSWSHGPNHFGLTALVPFGRPRRGRRRSVERVRVAYPVDLPGVDPVFDPIGLTVTGLLDAIEEAQRGREAREAYAGALLN